MIKNKRFLVLFVGIFMQLNVFGGIYLNLNNFDENFYFVNNEGYTFDTKQYLGFRFFRIFDIDYPIYNLNLTHEEDEINGMINDEMQYPEINQMRIGFHLTTKRFLFQRFVFQNMYKLDDILMFLDDNESLPMELKFGSQFTLFDIIKFEIGTFTDQSFVDDEGLIIENPLLKNIYFLIEIGD